MHRGAPLRTVRTLVFWSCLFAGVQGRAAEPAGLERQLLAEPVEQLAAAARAQGDAARGAIVFHQPHLACQRCHLLDGRPGAVGPDLTDLPPKTSDEQIVESVLLPSKTIRKGFETTVVTTTDGRALAGILAEADAKKIVLRDPTQAGKLVTIAAGDVDERRTVPTSVMPAGQVAQLASRQQFLDLVKYLFELRDGGRERARQLQPPPALVALQIPDYEQRIDHAGILRDLNTASFQRGEAIYQRLCINCHGTREQPGSLPTSLRFASGKFKSGADPYTMYQTLTRGFGLMTPQTWMVPQQKYDVIHYVREAYLKPHNPSQYVPIDDAYLASLPRGTTRGPAPSTFEAWSAMDYGPTMIGTFEIGANGENFAYKGIAARLDAGPGGVARGRHWSVFDHDTLRMAAAWSGTKFIDWQGIHFDGRHNAHPHVVGRVAVQNPTGPGWADPATGRFDDERRTVGRDGRRYGPLPRDWARYRGLHHHGDQAIVAYEVGGTPILESPSVVEDVGPPGNAAAPNGTGASGAKPTSREGAANESAGDGATAPVYFLRTLEIGPRPRPLVMLVATAPDAAARLTIDGGVARFGAPPPDASSPKEGAAAAAAPIAFDGRSHVEVARADDLDTARRDFTITARIRTKAGGTIFAKTKGEGPWVPDGTAWFVRGGRLAYDIGWVGALESRRRVDDDRWHDVAVRFRSERGELELWVDGKEDRRGTLRTKDAPADHVVRIGFTAPNFPEPRSYFQGELRDVRFFQRSLADDELRRPGDVRETLVAHWPLVEATGDRTVADAAGGKHPGRWFAGEGGASRTAAILAAVQGAGPGVEWTQVERRLCLKIPAGAEPLRLAVWTTDESARSTAAALRDRLADAPPPAALEPLTRGGPAHWPQPLSTVAQRGADDGPFAVDVLTHPATNPWFAQLRLTGLDFLPGGDRVAVCSWDGDVWLVDGLKSLDAPAPAPGGERPPAALVWRRIASGLFQPLGIKWVGDRLYVTCRDQLVVLHDRNGDGETDYYECWNNDHQVTEHFHEFAMGLQVDAEGNFYYAKSARHALPALVPHHGTLLKVSRDGSTTEILATGFRAANGVCLNPDGTFVVTDQEGHWNPKNRINWVERGGFYGNMFGYHDVTDSSDSAMRPPLCWITNAFDRSPAELLWTPRDAWGPLAGQLLNLSYGYGRAYVAPFEEVDGTKQGGLCALPIPALPTGIMRGRFHPDDKQLYACGMFAWAGSAVQPGGFYRLRATGRPMHLPVALRARRGKFSITFTEPLDRAAATDPAAYALKAWDLKRSANYGSQHHNERPWKVHGASLSEDGRTVTLDVPDLQPTWGMEIVCRLKAPDGTRFERTIHNSIFRLGE